MKYDLRDYQRLAVERAAAFLATAKPGERLLLASPTGTGKSVMELALREMFPSMWLLTPRVEIVAGMLDKLGDVAATWPEERMMARAWDLHITTPVRFYNKLIAGEQEPPTLLCFDEGHHDLADTYQSIHALCGYAPAVAFTATPFRGTPKGTALFRKTWGDPVWILTFREAMMREVLTMPRCEVLPLVDDDEIEIANGELVARQVSDKTRTRLAELVEYCKQWFRDAAPYSTERMWDRPTMFACPSSEIARELQERLQQEGLRSCTVLQDTSHADRKVAFAACIRRVAALVQVAVVSEGVDLPIRRLIDLKPTLSPVLWLQQFGRITRPGGGSHYVCTNRNLFRHAYALDGAVPQDDLLKAQAAFKAPSGRDSTRVLGLEALGRLKPVDLPLRSGLRALLYCISAVQENDVVDYCAIAHPNREEVFWARRSSIRQRDVLDRPMARLWGKWERCESPDDVTGYASIAPKPVTEKQAQWWQRAASRHGLDPTVEPNAKQFAALPVLADTGGRL